jgi:hypothetical protein
MHENSDTGLIAMQGILGTLLAPVSFNIAILDSDLNIATAVSPAPRSSPHPHLSYTTG